MITFRRMLRHLDSLSLQKLYYVLGISIAVIVFIWLVSVRKQQHSAQFLESEITSIKQHLSTAREEIKILQQDLHKIPLQTIQQQESILRNDILKEKSVASKQCLSSGTDSVEEVLKRVVDSLHGLQVEGLLSLTTSDLTESEKKQLDKLVGQRISVMGIQMNLYGSFQDTIDFLRNIEAMPINLLWERMDYFVKDYPNADIKLRFFIICKSDSLNQGLKANVSIQHPNRVSRYLL